ncbi:hypothetical protein COOONC_14716 [Cooperia oncophora]
MDYITFEGVAAALRDEIKSLVSHEASDRPTAAELLRRIGSARGKRAVFRAVEKSTSPTDKDYFLDKDWDFESEDVIHPPSLRMKRKYDCTAFGTPPIRKRLTFDELEEDELPTPKADSTIIEYALENFLFISFTYFLPKDFLNGILCGAGLVSGIQI